MNPVSLNDLANFFANIMNAYDSYFYFAITFMFAANAMVLTRRLLVGYKQ